MSCKQEKHRGASGSAAPPPALAQLRLAERESALAPPSMKPLRHRPLDVAFFAHALGRCRAQLRRGALSKRPGWRAQLEGSLQAPAMADAHQGAKVCLVAHSYRSKAGGECHQLSELATMGCVPAVEELAGALAVDDCARCGGVVLASYDTLTGAVSTVLGEVNANE